MIELGALMKRMINLKAPSDQINLKILTGCNLFYLRKKVRNILILTKTSNLTRLKKVSQFGIFLIPAN